MLKFVYLQQQVHHFDMLVSSFLVTRIKGAATEILLMTTYLPYNLHTSMISYRTKIALLTAEMLHTDF
jgi:hypothetical protein